MLPLTIFEQEKYALAWLKLEALSALGVPALVGDQVKLLADAKEVSRHYVQHLKHYVQHLKYF